MNLGACSNFPFSTQPNVNDEDATPNAFLRVHEYFPASETDNLSISKITIPNECTLFNLEPRIFQFKVKFFTPQPK